MCPHLCHFSFITRSFLHPIWIIIFGSKVVEILIILMKLTQSTPVKVPGLFVRYHCARFKVPLPMSADCGGVLEERRSLSVVYAYSSYADARNHAIHDWLTPPLPRFVVIAFWCYLHGLLCVRSVRFHDLQELVHKKLIHDLSVVQERSSTAGAVHYARYWSWDNHLMVEDENLSEKKVATNLHVCTVPQSFSESNYMNSTASERLVAKTYSNRIPLCFLIYSLCLISMCSYGWKVIPFSNLGFIIKSKRYHSKAYDLGLHIDVCLQGTIWLKNDAETECTLNFLFFPCNKSYMGQDDKYWKRRSIDDNISTRPPLKKRIVALESLTKVELKPNTSLLPSHVVTPSLWAPQNLNLSCVSCASTSRYYEAIIIDFWPTFAKESNAQSFHS